jgi:hypothetical protein
MRCRFRFSAQVSVLLIMLATTASSFEAYGSNVAAIRCGKSLVAFHFSAPLSTG